jgi:hypothetical protein
MSYGRGSHPTRERHCPRFVMGSCWVPPVRGMRTVRSVNIIIDPDVNCAIVKTGELKRASLPHMVEILN